MRPKPRTWAVVLLAIVVLAAFAALLEFVVVPLIRQEASPTNDTQAATETPTLTVSTAPVETTAAETVTTEAVTAASVTTAPIPTETPTEPLPQPTPTDVFSGPGDVTTKAYQSGTIFITEGCGYGVYYFGETNSTRYCEAVSRVARAVAGQADVEDLGVSDENKAMTWMFDHMDPLVKPVPVYGTLKRHNDENIFFHTDHHWTALGAYYAYREFCAQKGIRPHELTDFETYTYTDYQGSFVNYSNGNAELKANPDTLVAYLPNGTNTMTTYMPDGTGSYNKYTWPIVKDVSGYNRGSYYLGFVAGDQPYSYAHNETIIDGSAVLVVKDSYGNALIPFLIDHYEHIYWIDYRSYQAWCPWAGVDDSSLSSFVARNSITDVILCNNISSTGSGTNLNDMEKIFR